MTTPDPTVRAQVRRFYQLSRQLDRSMEQTAELARQRAQIAAGLTTTLLYRQVAELLGVSSARVGQMVRLVRDGTRHKR